MELWKRIYNKGKAGRRLGLGTTADGDMVAAMGLTYGTQEANDFLSKVHKYIGVNSYMESILLAEERGSFDAFDWELEKDDYFVNKMMESRTYMVRRYIISIMRNGNLMVDVI